MKLTMKITSVVALSIVCAGIYASWGPAPDIIDIPEVVDIFNINVPATFPTSRDFQ